MTDQAKDLRSMVFSSLNSAKEGGYGDQIIKAGSADIADELVALDADLEDQDARDLEPFVAEWIQVELEEREKNP